MTPIIVEPEARDEIRAARDWYAARQAGLGADFVAELDAALTTVVERPHSFPVIARDARRALVRRFPYLVVFVERGGQIIVIGVFHAKRNPALWVRRAAQRGT